MRCCDLMIVWLIHANALIGASPYGHRSNNVIPPLKTTGLSMHRESVQLQNVYHRRISRQLAQIKIVFVRNTRTRSLGVRVRVPLSCKNCRRRVSDLHTHTIQNVVAVTIFVVHETDADSTAKRTRERERESERKNGTQWAIKAKRIK